MQPVTVSILSTASDLCLFFDVTVSMLDEVIERLSHRLLGAVEGPDGFGSSAPSILPINVGCKATQGSLKLPVAGVVSNPDNDGLHTQRRGRSCKSDTGLCIHLYLINTNKDDQCVRRWTKRSMLLLLLSGDYLTRPGLLRSFVTTLYIHGVERLLVASFNSPINKEGYSTWLKPSIDAYSNSVSRIYNHDTERPAS